MAGPENTAAHVDPRIAMPSLVETNVGSSKRDRLNATQGPTTSTVPAATTATGRSRSGHGRARQVRSSGSARSGASRISSARANAATPQSRPSANAVRTRASSARR